jgi:hypothetical protein
MSNRYTVTRYVTGTPELAAALAHMAKEAQTTIIMEGVTAAIEPIQDTMVGLCPIRTDTVKVNGRKLQPGEMKASIRTKVIGYPSSGKAVGLVGPADRAGLVAHLVEFGHLVAAPRKGHTIRRGNAIAARNGRTHVAAKPFIRPAVLTTLGAQGAAFTRGATEAYLASVKSN